jgi:transposase
MKPYSLDLRERVIAALEKGDLTQPEIADKYDISLRTVETWARQWRTTGNIAPKPHRSGPARTLRAYTAIIRQAVHRQPDQTLGELCALVAAQTQVRASASMMCRELQHLNLPRKKVAPRQPTRNAARPSLTRRTSRQNGDNVTPYRRTPKIHR